MSNKFRRSIGHRPSRHAYADSGFLLFNDTTRPIGVFIDLINGEGLGKYPGMEGVVGYRRELNGTVHSSCITPNII